MDPQAIHAVESFPAERAAAEYRAVSQCSLPICARCRELEAERNHLASILAVIQDVHAQHADDLCWMDIDRIFAAAGLPVPDRRVGDQEAMLKNCRRFVTTMCQGGVWKSYMELEAERDRLQNAVWKLEGDVRAQTERLRD